MIEWLYYITFFICIVLTLINLKHDTKYIFFIALIPIILVTFFRFGNGTDYFSYQFLYENQVTDTFGKMLDHQVRFELGFRVLIFIFKSFGVSSHVFIGLLSTIILLFFSLWIFENSENRMLSLTVFYGFFYLVWVLSALRQGIVLSVGTYIFMSKKRKLSLKFELLLILLLSTIHASALFYILVILYRSYKKVISYKTLIIIFSLSLVTTLIPISSLLHMIDFLPLVGKIADASVNSPGFFDFASIVRLILVLYLFFLLFYYDWDRFERQTIQISILGFSLYFFMKTNELWAGRFGIFTFILMCLIFSMHFSKIQFSLFKISFVPALFIVSFLFFQKDALSSQDLMGKLELSNFIKFKSFTNVAIEDYWGYSNQNSFYLYHKRRDAQEKEIFYEKNNFTQSTYNESISNVAIYNPITKKYSITNENGDFVTEKEFGLRPKLHNKVLQVNKAGGLKPYVYEDIFNLNLTADEIQDNVNTSVIKIQQHFQEIPDANKLNYSEIKNKVSHLFPDGNIPKIETVMNFKMPFEYNIMQIKYFNYTVFVFMDQNYNLLVDDVFLSLNRFNQDGFLLINNFNNGIVSNSQGEIIWYE